MTTMTNTRSRAIRVAKPGAIALGMGLGSVLVLGGCRGERSEEPPRQIFPDMDDSPKWKPQSGSDFFVDGRIMRPNVAGTVAWGRSTDPNDPRRAAMLKEDDAFYHGTDGAGAPVAYIPAGAFEAIAPGAADSQAAITAAITRGRQRFDIYCSACHGYQGNGKGEVGVRWSSLPANFHDEKFKDRSVETGTDGHIFQVIRNGLIDQTGAVKMPPYGHAVNEADAWAIVAYVRTLQASWTISLEGMSQEQRSELERSRPPEVIPAAPAAGSPSSGAPATPSPASAPPASTTPAGTPANAGERQ
ncbi:MAG: cytochrome c [Phycisphaerales bacterium]|nr:cytochrome c [Phycisphaerales bacterium]